MWDDLMGFECCGDCCHCWYANICSMCEDGGVDSD